MKSKIKNLQLNWKAGVSRIDITPKETIWLHGWGSRTKPMQGVSHPIYARVLTLRDGEGNTGVLVSADILGFSFSTTAVIARRAKAKYGLERAQLILNASHNHSGPAMTDVLPLYFPHSAHDQKVIHRYTNWFVDRVVDAIGAALKDLKPARLAFGQGLAGFAVNRRRAREGGRSLATVIDQDVPVLSVLSERDELRGIVFGYGCHPTCIEDGKINGDWPGYAQSALEESHPGTVAMFVQNCGGDINPLPRFRPGLGEMYGKILAAAVEQVLESQARDQQLSGQRQGGKLHSIHSPLRMAFTEAKLPFDTLPTKKELLSLTSGAGAMRRREVDYQLSLLKNGDRRPRALTYPIHVWQFGSDLKLIALSSETVTDYSLRFKKEYGWDNTWVSGYNDDYWCYIPSLRIWREGGYEGHTGMLECSLPGPFASTAEEIIAATVERLVEQTNPSPRKYPRSSKHA
jgi:hypothetical protein